MRCDRKMNIFTVLVHITLVVLGATALPRGFVDPKADLGSPDDHHELLHSSQKELSLIKSHKLR